MIARLPEPMAGKESVPTYMDAYLLTTMYIRNWWWWELHYIADGD